MNIEDEIAQYNFPSPQEKGIVNVIFTSNWVTNMLLEELKPFDINEQHFNILRILRGRFPGYACPGEIKKILINKKGDLTRLLDKLVRKGYIDRRQDEKNRRSIQYFILQEGLDILSQLDKSNKHMSEITGKISDEEAEELNRILDKLRN